MTSTTAATADATLAVGTPSPPSGIVRDVARAGITETIVGLLVAGVGGRLVMRLAALLVPQSVGAFTENGDRIGELTLGGSVGLLVALVAQ